MIVLILYSSELSIFLSYINLHFSYYRVSNEASKCLLISLYQFYTMVFITTNHIFGCRNTFIGPLSIALLLLVPTFSSM